MKVAALLLLLVVIMLQGEVSEVGVKEVRKEDRLDKLFMYHTQGTPFNWKLIKAQAIAESSLDRYAVSKAGARGIMQLMPGTAREVGVIDIFDWDDNIRGGVLYMVKLYNRFEPHHITKMDSIKLSLASYVGGVGYVMAARRRVFEKGGEPTWEEVLKQLGKVSIRGRRPRVKTIENYVNKVIKMWKEM